MDLSLIFQTLGICVVTAPAALTCLLGVSALFGRPMRERATAFWTEAAVLVGLVAAFGVLVLMLVTGRREVPVEIGNWVVLPEEHFHFRIKFVFDRLSVPFVLLSFVLVGTIGAFANRYLHREKGYSRFFLFYSLFLLGMVLASLAGTIETLFVGWELVGLSSALLVAYFHERRLPVVNGQRVWSVYRVSDAAFLVAAVALHHVSGEGDFSILMGTGGWPHGTASLTHDQAFFVGILLLIAAAGKSALIPFSGWLPRAMEGPTPSSAVFYGALSVHLGAFLLLRVSPLLELSPGLSALVVGLGLLSAFFGAMSARVQSDAKSALAFASLTQVGLIVAEIGLGFRYLALIHIIGHACLRTLQLLRAPSLLKDYHLLENAIGGRLTHRDGWFNRLVPEGLRLRMFRFAFERGNFDSLLDRLIVAPFLAIFRWCDRREQAWMKLLNGESSSERSHTPDVPVAANSAAASSSDDPEVVRRDTSASPRDAQSDVQDAAREAPTLPRENGSMRAGRELPWSNGQADSSHPSKKGASGR